MDYPNGFDIKSFLAGKTIALSRTFAIWISIAFFLIVAMCVFLLLGMHFKKNYPFLISVDPFTEEWSVITYPGKSEKESVQQYQIVQEKLVHDFVTNWFTISADEKTNEARWQQCDTEECAQSEQFNPDNIKCAMSCKSDSSVFETFEKNVLPDYKTYANSGGKWVVNKMLITPPYVPKSDKRKKVVNTTTGTWQVVVSIQPSMSAPFDALVFITIEQDLDKYPATFGYYIANFNSYRIVNE